MREKGGKYLKKETILVAKEKKNGEGKILDQY